MLLIRCMMDELDKLREENIFLKSEIKRLRNRGSGRKEKFNSYQIENLKNSRKQGNTYKQIAENYNCSISLVYKLINK